MPALTDLLIGSISDDLEGSSPYPVVDLPRLRALSISSGVGALTAVLRNITFPHSAILELTCKKNKSTQIDFSNFLSVLATKFLSSLIFRSLSLQAAIDGLEFCLWTTAIIHDCFPISDPQLKLLLTWPTPYSPVHVKALTCAFDAMSLPFLIQLKISTSDCIDSQTWVETFGRLPLLEWVCVRECYGTKQFLEALVYKTKAAEKSKAAYRNISFPKLRYIQLESIYFGENFSASISVDMLLDCLMERFERNAGVQGLRLEDCCAISSRDVELLEEIVVGVIWE